MMKVLKWIFASFYIVGYAANGLLYLLMVYSQHGGSFINFINPLAWFAAIFDWLFNPWFWGFLAWTMIFYFASIGAERMEQEM